MEARLAGGLKRIEREPLGDIARTQLRDALFAGRFEPGSVLTLRYLAEIFGTSITPVRDAVTRLIAEGVLEQGPRSAAVVPDVKADALRHLVIVRSELEGRAAREAVAHATPADIDRLGTRLQEMRALIASRNLDTYLDIHRQFHFGIYQMSRVPVLIDMIEGLWLRCGPVLSFVIPEYVLSLKGTDHHQAILEAMRKGDPEAAEREMVADIEEAASYLMSLSDAQGRIRPRAKG